jgi:hypothetical protein
VTKRKGRPEQPRWFRFSSQLQTLTSHIPLTPFYQPSRHIPIMADTSAPSIFRYTLGFLLIGLAWGFTTPFIRIAAKTHSPPPHPILNTPGVKNSWVKSKIYGAFFGVVDLLRNPRYAIPLVINLTGSVWFFLLIGKAGMYCYCFHFSALSLGLHIGYWRKYWQQTK